MEEEEAIYGEDIQREENSDDDEVDVNDLDSEAEEQENLKFVVKASHEAKLRELLHNINLIEVKLYSDASKEFIKLLRRNTGGELLHQYAQTSSKFSELQDAWKRWQGKPGMSYILSLISAILSHPDGIYRPNDTRRIAISRIIDKFARSIVEEKLEDIYKELNSKEGKRQKAALLLMASIVRRSSSLASEVAKSFNFKFPVFPKLAEYKLKQVEKKRKHSTRKSFIGFAMSFLEVGKPGLLRWILQQKEMYSGVLRGLGSDDVETVVYVLSTLKDRVLIPESLVPPGLRSVLFGSVTLEQLVSISGREDGGPASELAHRVLVMVCTDPCNGLMPDLKRHPYPLRGNPKRLLGLMKKLKATEVAYHRDLLLSIVKGRPSFCSAYMDEFPYKLEDHKSSTWFAAVSLAADLVSSVGIGLPFNFINSESLDLPSFDSSDVQSIMKCICCRPFSRLVVNKGLLHPNVFVKHGTLRLLLEELKFLDSFVSAINHTSCSSNQMMHRLAPLKQEIENEVRMLLPDPQVLLTLLSSLSSQSRIQELGLKRKGNSENFNVHRRNDRKKLKTDVLNEDTDIIVSGISSGLDIAFHGGEKALDTFTADDMDSGKDNVKIIAKIWGLQPSSMGGIALRDVETCFHSKLLDALKIYARIMPTVLEGSFDFFINLLGNSSALSIDVQQSVLSLLIEYIGRSPKSEIPIRVPALMYKHLQPFIDLLIFSSTRDIREQAFYLALAAMFSTGVFDSNISELGAWFLFLPGYGRASKSSVDTQGVEVFQSLSTAVISFFCDAVSTIGNNSFKYWDLMRLHISHLKGIKDVSPHFSPLIICVLEKCQRVLKSGSGTFTLAEKSIISLYVSNTLTYLLQTQVDPGLLSSLLDLVLSERLEDQCLDSMEWRPLKNLLLFSQDISHQRHYCIFSIDEKARHTDSSFNDTLAEVQRIVRSGHDSGLTGIAKMFSSSIVGTTPDDILKNFPSVITVSQDLQGVPFALLSSISFHDRSLLARASKLWPDIFFSGLQRVGLMIHSKGKGDDNCRIPSHSLSAEEIFPKTDFGLSESASVAFSLFLQQAPFHVLFPAIMNIDGPYLLEPSKVQQLLLAKLSEQTTDYLILSLRHVLFWIHQIRSYYRIRPLGELEHLFEVCFILVERMLDELLVLRPDSDCSTTIGVPFSTVQEVAEIIFCHPAVMVSLSCPLSCHEELTKGTIGDSLETFLRSSKHSVHKMDHHVLNLLISTSDYLVALCDGQNPISKVDDSAKKQLVKVFKALLQRLLLELRSRFDVCIRTKNFVPFLQAFYASHILSHFISPFKLFELAYWMFSRVDLNDLTTGEFDNMSALSVVFCIASGAFDMLSSYFQHPITKKVQFDLFWEMEEKSFDIIVFEKIYMKALEFATCFKLEFADVCLLKAVKVMYRQKFEQHQSFLLPLSLVSSRVIVSTPVKMISHCINRPSMIRAKLLFLLIEVSPLHSSVFGHLFSGLLNKGLPHKDNVVETPSDEGFMMLLPAALSYLKSTSLKFGKQYYTCFKGIPSLYSRILLDGFLDWKGFVSRSIFQIEDGEFLPSSTEDLSNLVNSSLLGKSIHMLWFYFAFSGHSMKKKKRFKLFDVIFPCSGQDGMLDCDVSEIDSYSLNQSLNFVNRVVAKISLCRMLLFPGDCQVKSLSKESDGPVEDTPLEMGLNREDSSRIRLINILVNTWQKIVERFSCVSDNSGKVTDTDCLPLFKFLEVFILRNVLELAREMHNSLIQLHSLPFLEKLTRLSLLHRFEDATTLKMLRSVLTSLSEGKFSHVLLLQLLLAHSQFAPSVQSVSKSSGCSQVGVFSKPMSSILRSLTFTCTDQGTIDGNNNFERSDLCVKQLEVIKLLRLLLCFKGHWDGSDLEKNIDINARELISLLLSSYGAMLNEVDLEIYSLMHEIESNDRLKSGSIAAMDYLWGSSALRIRKERVQELEISANNILDAEAVEERQRSQFRENLPIDPKLCMNTVLYFPYNRTASDGPISLNKVHPDNVKDMIQGYPPHVENVPRYDPVFILHFSIHSLSMRYIEPVEFSALGLLAVAFVSLSSPDDMIRKLGYETLGRFKNALEMCQKRKDVMQLRLLLTYMQNGIEEPWQRIPSVTAIFAAEASFILLDPSHEHYSTISKLLMRSTGVNMKCIPLFNNFIWSSSINFKSERLWILRLSYAGLNLEDDAQIYIRNSILETILSFYASPFSDNESKELILQIVKKSVKLHKMARYLVEHCGLISWLSSALSFFSERLSGDQRSFWLKQLTIVTEVINNVISSRNIIGWLQKDALEQLSEVALHLYKLLIGAVQLMKDNVTLVNSILQILISTLKFSQKRKIYQPRFTISIEGLFKIYQAVVDVSSVPRSSPASEFGLKVILMSSPPLNIFQMKQEELQEFVGWTISTALQPECTGTLQLAESYLHFRVFSEEEPSQDSLLSKLLRWLTASVILGMLSWKSTDLDINILERSNSKTSLSLLEHVKKGSGKNGRNAFHCEEILAASIFYLQQLLGLNSRVLPSVVSALCLLLLSDASNSAGSEFMLGHESHVASLCSRIHCPVEANPAWRWSFYQPWKDLTSEQTDLEKMDELHACQSLLVVISNFLGKKSLDAPFLSHQDAENSGVYKWERSIIETESHSRQNPSV